MSLAVPWNCAAQAAGQRGVDIGRRALLGCLFFCVLAPIWARSSTGPRIDLRIASDGDELRFVPDRLVCEEQARVRLQLRHTGRISRDRHDWVLLKPGTEAAFVREADRETEDVVVPRGARADVIAVTPLCAPGDTVTVCFVAPAAGDYPFVCSVPGHGETMRGTLSVLARARHATRPPS